MNLTHLRITPHAEGFIKIACENDPAFTDRARTKNEFLITTRVHVAGTGAGLDGMTPGLAPHPIREKLETEGEGDTKVVREIPFRMFFNKAEHAISIDYQAFTTDDKHIPICAGNGRDATRLVVGADQAATTQQVACPGPERCELVQRGDATCLRQVRMPVQIKDQPNPFTTFEVRTTSLNTYRALKGQLQLIERMFGGLRHVPLKLSLWQASNEVSGYEPFDLMRLDLDAPSLAEAKKAVDAARKELADAGINDDIDDAQ